MARPSPARLLLPALFLMTACGLPLVVLLLYNAPGGMLNAPVHDGLSRLNLYNHGLAGPDHFLN